MEEASELGDWRKLSILGSGAFGVVSLWRNMRSDDCVAIKKCRWDQPANIPRRARERWTQEVDFMKTVHHPNIVAYKTLPADFVDALESFNLSRLPLLPMEYCAGGNLRRLLLQPRNACGLREPDVRRVLADIAAAVSHLHAAGITHRDIKPDNVVLQQQPGGGTIYKLIDLGYAKDVNLLVSFVGTLQYTAPEIFRNTEYTHNVDYWSFGILAYELCCGKHPFLPKMDAFQRFELIAQKAPRDICIYQSSANGKIIHTDKILEPNHISACLRTHLEDWLGAMLEYRSAERGRMQGGGDVFEVLRGILAKSIVHVFVVYAYADYYYEITMDTRLADLQRMVQETSGLAVDEQLIVARNAILDPARANASLIRDLGIDGSVVVVFKRNEYVRPAKVVLPLAVRNLLQNNKQQWDQLSVQTALAVHYVEEEAAKMVTLRNGIDAMQQYMCAFLLAPDDANHGKNAAAGRGVLMKDMHAEAVKALQLVAFCKDVNEGCGMEMCALKTYRKCLWRTRELVENANAAMVRYLKMKARARLLRVSFEKVVKRIVELKIDTLYDDAMNCMNINKQKAVITAKSITIVICACLKARSALQHDDAMTQHIQLCFKVLREHEKLMRWMRALVEQLRRANGDLLAAQRNLHRTTLDKGAIVDVATVQQRLQACSLRDVAAADGPATDDLIKDNRALRYKMQEMLSSLLWKHKAHANGVREFVEFVDGLPPPEVVSS